MFVSNRYKTNLNFANKKKTLKIIYYEIHMRTFCGVYYGLVVTTDWMDSRFVNFYRAD